MNKIFRGEIWMADLSPTKGREQRGIRPVLIISANEFNNCLADLCIILPLTTTIRGIPTHISISPPSTKKESVIMCEAIRSISKDRLINKVGNASDDILETVEGILSLLLGLS